MIRPICHDPLLLARPARPALEGDLAIARDLADTLAAHREGCVGMAANMIGQAVAIITFYDEGEMMTMLNPRILSAHGPYEAEEGCLSLPGLRRTERYQKIQVEYQNLKLQKKKRTFQGFTAQIIQHEMDHLKGVLI